MTSLNGINPNGPNAQSAFNAYQSGAFSLNDYLNYMVGSPRPPEGGGKKRAKRRAAWDKKANEALTDLANRQQLQIQQLQSQVAGMQSSAQAFFGSLMAGLCAQSFAGCQPFLASQAMCNAPGALLYQAMFS